MGRHRDAERRDDERDDSPDAPPALPFRADYHTHTKWCDATGEMRDYVNAALALGLTEIGFSVHMPITVPIAEKLYLSKEQMPLYIAEGRRLQAEFAGRIDVLLGGECDFAPGQEHEIAEAIRAYPFDYLIGSVHFIDGWGFDNPNYRSGWETGSVDAIYRRYYELVAGAARSGFYDIIGHFDLAKKFGHRPAGDVSDAECAAADAVAAAGLAVEINTAGLDGAAGEQYPSERILRLLYERRVPICLGSDAHRPEHVGRHFARARELARSIGWTTVARFRARRRTEEPLAP